MILLLATTQIHRGFHFAFKLQLTIAIWDAENNQICKWAHLQLRETWLYLYNMDLRIETGLSVIRSSYQHQLQSRKIKLKGSEFVFSSLQGKENYIGTYESYKEGNVLRHTQWERRNLTFIKGLVYIKSFTYLTTIFGDRYCYFHIIKERKGEKNLSIL